MHLTTFAKYLWAVGWLSTLLVLVVIAVRGLWRKFPVFTAWRAFGLLRTIVLFLLYTHGLHAAYAQVYWKALWIDYALQFSLAIEVAAIVLRPTGAWIRDAWNQFAMVSFAGVVLAGLMAWWVTPPAPTRAVMWELRGNLFTSLVICELFVVMMLTSTRLGLGWRNHVMAVGQALTAWTAVMVVTSALQSYFGSGHLFLRLEHVRMEAWILAMLWIAFRLWSPEPQRLPIDPDLKRFIVALHERVEYDLQRIDAHR